LVARALPRQPGRDRDVSDGLYFDSAQADNFLCLLVGSIALAEEKRKANLKEFYVDAPQLTHVVEAEVVSIETVEHGS